MTNPKPKNLSQLIEDMVEKHHPWSVCCGGDMCEGSKIHDSEVKGCFKQAMREIAEATADAMEVEETFATDQFDGDEFLTFENASNDDWVSEGYNQAVKDQQQKRKEWFKDEKN